MQLPMKSYQTEYSKINPSLYNEDTRKIKAKKILAVLKNIESIRLGKCRCIEIGCSTGINTNFLATYCKECVGIDIDIDAVLFARSNSDPSTQFLIGDAIRVPFTDNSCDIVICNHVYEHVPDSQLLMKEIFRILRPGGICYFAAGNKYSIIEGHYKLPFLSWLPKSMAHVYLKLTGNGQLYYENHLSYFGLRKLVKDFSVMDYTLKIVQNPRQFGAEDMIHPNSLITSVPIIFLKMSQLLIPTYIFVLVKPHR